MILIVESRPYEAITGVVVCFTAGIIILETDLRASDEQEPLWVAISNWFLMVFYFVDVIMRLYAFRWSFFECRWNLMDLFLIASDVIFKVVELIAGDAPSFSILRLCKIFRVMRFARVVSLFKELHMMLAGFVSAMKALMWASVMLTIMLTFWSILAVEIAHPINMRLAERDMYVGCERCPRAFSSVMHANLTFLQQIIAGDSWGQVSVPIIEEEPLIALFFFAVLLTVNFGLLNLVLTVIVDSAQAARDADEQRKLADKSHEFEQAKKKLMSVCSDLDKDGSGELTYAELMEGIEYHPEFSATMALLDVNKDDMSIVFDMLDQDNSGSVTFTEFAEQLHKMKSQDDHTMLIFIRGYLNEVRKKVAEQIRYTKDETFNSVHQTLAISKDLKSMVDAMLTGTSITTNGKVDQLPLAVSIAGAKGLYESGDMNGNGRAPPNSSIFCVCEVEGKPRARLQTPIATLDRDPQWTYDGTLNGYVLGDSLVFTVWRKSDSQNEMVGQSVISAEELRNNPSGFQGNVPLRRAGQTFASLEVKVGDLSGCLRWTPDRALVEAPPVSLQSISQDIKLLFSRMDSEFSQSPAWRPNGQATSLLPQPSATWPLKPFLKEADSRSMSANLAAHGMDAKLAARIGGPEVESPCPCCKVSQIAKEKAQIRPSPTAPRIQPRPP